jgi:hypothetical protein
MSDRRDAPPAPCPVCSRPLPAEAVYVRGRTGAEVLEHAVVCSPACAERWLQERGD